MDVKATARYLPIAPTKIRLVCDEVRGMNALAAAYQLEYMPQKGAEMVLKVLRSAMANAENNFDLDANGMIVLAVYANEGPRRQWRRFGARGRYKPVIKRTSHVTVVLSEPAYVVEDAPVVEPVGVTIDDDDEGDEE